MEIDGLIGPSRRGRGRHKAAERSGKPETQATGVAARLLRRGQERKSAQASQHHGVAMSDLCHSHLRFIPLDSADHLIRFRHCWVAMVGTCGAKHTSALCWLPLWNMLERSACRYQRFSSDALFKLLENVSEMDGCPSVHVGQVDGVALLWIDGQIDDMRACKLL